MEPDSSQPFRAIEPLRQKNAKGILYQRDPAVESQLEWAVTLSTDDLQENLRQAKPGEQEFLKEETLVYLIRDAHFTHQPARVVLLWEALLRRCIRMIRSKMPQVDTLKADAYQEIQVRLFAEIVHEEGKPGDFLQVRFWPRFQTLVIDVARLFIRNAQKDSRLDPLSALPGEDVEELEEVKAGSAQPQVRSVEVPIEQNVIHAEGLRLLPDRLKKALLLHEYYGFPVESDDPTEQTVSKMLGKSPRTIYLWLSQAEDILKQWRGETHEPSI